jgi:hypothetical protein
VSASDRASPPVGAREGHGTVRARSRAPRGSAGRVEAAKLDVPSIVPPVAGVGAGLPADHLPQVRRQVGVVGTDVQTSVEILRPPPNHDAVRLVVDQAQAGFSRRISR